METLQGPKLSDARFFGELLDCTQPGLEDIPALAAANDYAACRRIFAAQVRATLRPEVFFTIPYEFGENSFTFPGETEEEAARRIAKHCLISVGTPFQFGETVDWFANPTYNQYKEWTWQLCRHHEWKLLAHQYRLTGEEWLADTCVELFKSWVRQAVAPEDHVSCYETKCWRTIECGIRMGAEWPYTLHAFYKTPAFTDDVLVDWYKSVWEHGHRLRYEYRSGNWLIMEMNGLGQIGILYPQFKASPEWLQFALQMLTQELDRQVYPDNFQYELATGYHYVVIINYLRLIRVANAYGVAIPSHFMQRLEKMLELFVQIMKPDTRVPDINDGSRAEAAAFIKPQIEFFAHNRTMQWLLRGRTGDGMPAYTSMALPYAGMMVMRTGWGKDDVWGFLDAAPFGAGHQHEDKLNFLLYAQGRSILTECGSYAYDGSEMRRYALSTRAHNTVRVNGMDQNRRVCYRWHDEDILKPSGMVWRSEPWFDYAVGEYDEGYGSSDNDTAFVKKGETPDPDRPAYMGLRHRRTVLFLKKPGHGLDPCFIVIDRLFSEDENEYEQLWHVDAENITVHDMHVQADFLHILSSLNDPKADGVSVVVRQRFPEWQGWQPGPTHIQGDDIALPTVRYTAHGSNVRAVTVLYPDAHCPVVAVKADRAVEDTRFSLVLQNGEQLDFDETLFGPQEEK